MMLFGPNLRSTMTAAVVALALLAILTAGALVGLTTVIHQSGRRASVAADNVRLTEAAQRGLLMHDRLHDNAARDQISHSISDRLRELRPQLVSDEQRATLAIVDRTAASYLSAGAGTPVEEVAARHAEALMAVEALLTREHATLREADATVRQLDDLADLIGAIVAGVVSVSAGMLVWWLNARALRPLFGLAGTMRQFGQGDLEARATAEGPGELAEMAHRFNEMASAITRQRKDRQAFIAGVVHDLRAPLSVLRMAADLATTSGTKLPQERLSKVLGTVARQVTRLERMSGDLLESVTIEAGRVTLRTEELDAREVATEVVALYEGSSAKHTVDLELPEEVVAIRCDRMRLEQVLANLLSNAIKYSPAGGAVTLRLEERAGDVIFTVHDNGVGMSDADAAMAFEPFRRSATLRDEVPGSGLGLYIVQRLVEAHGGRIDLRTAPGRGSTFEVRMPAAGPSRDVSRGRVSTSQSFA